MVNILICLELKSLATEILISREAAEGVSEIPFLSEKWKRVTWSPAEFFSGR
jgi:hypothetical protein